MRFAVFLCCNSNREKFNSMLNINYRSNNVNPEWSTSVIVNYRFEEVQELRFFVYDIDVPGKGDECARAVFNLLDFSC